MKMKKRVLKAAGKAAGYAIAPKLTFAANNPGKAALAKAGQWAVGRMMPERRQSSAGSTALKGLGAAALALPLGWWLGRMLMDRRESGSRM